MKVCICDRFEECLYSVVLSIKLGEKPWYLYFQHYYRGGWGRARKNPYRLESSPRSFYNTTKQPK